MNSKYYPYFANKNFKEYEFFSEGPRGKIKKVVSFIQIEDDPVIYNMGFGDVDPGTGLISDLSITNNQDTDIVLATVANTIVDFSSHYGNQYIYAQGSTSSRTRLYQMSISNLWEEISIHFELYGMKNGVWHEFQKNINYEAFLTKKK